MKVGVFSSSRGYTALRVSGRWVPQPIDLLCSQSKAVFQLETLKLLADVRTTNKSEGSTDATA